MPTSPEKIPTAVGRLPHGEDSVWGRRQATAREPWLTDAVVSVSAPAVAVVGMDGQIRPYDSEGYSTAFGYYDQDRRILSCAKLTVDGVVPECLTSELVDATTSRHYCLVRTNSDPTPDAELSVERLHRAGLGERITLRSLHVRPRNLTVELQVAADLADVSEVRRGQPPGSAKVEPLEDARVLRWRQADGETAVELAFSRPPDDVTSDGVSGFLVTWQVRLGSRSDWSVDLDLSVRSSASAPHAVRRAFVEESWCDRPAVSGRRLRALVSQGLQDVRALLLRMDRTPGSLFAAAGAPWYLTLFGRDSLWTARFLLPVDRDRDLTYGTLASLAALQGKREDSETDEEDGKILHELRRTVTEHQQGEVLPPVYYGSMDAPALFVVLLVEAFRANSKDSRIKDLIPNARKALMWMQRRVEADPEGFLRYRALREGALFNHGWKDSADAVISLDGALAQGPIALCEIQAYAVQAAYGFAELLDGTPGAAESDKESRQLREWADGLRLRFLERFRVTDGPEPYFAMALDADGRIVDGLTSNIGHLLGTGILDHEQSAQVARQLVSEELFSGFGLRTRSSRHPRYNPLGYHSGAVWAHDTAIAIRGLAIAAGECHAIGKTQSAKECAAAARKLTNGFLKAAEHFEFRLPELFSGDGAKPVRFPAACRPQAWSSASGIAVMEAQRRISQLPL